MVVLLRGSIFYEAATTRRLWRYLAGQYVDRAAVVQTDRVAPGTCLGSWSIGNCRSIPGTRRKEPARNLLLHRRPDRALRKLVAPAAHPTHTLHTRHTGFPRCELWRVISPPARQ